MKHLKRITGVLLIVLITVSVATAQNFNINGTVEGLADGTWLYLRTAQPEKKLDSAKIIGGKFRLSGKTDHQITHVGLYTAKYTNYVFFWLESNPMNIVLKSGEFKKAIIKGSATQTEEEMISKLEEPIRKKEDSLYTLLNRATDLQVQKDVREQLKAVKNEEYLFYLNYVQQHPNSLIATNAISIYTTTWGKEKINTLYQHLSPAMKKTSYGQNIYDFISLNKTISIGKPFVDFEQTNTKGKKVKLSDIKGKYILLEFWGSWCGPCREENPKLVKPYNLFKDKGFAILGVAADDNKEQWLKAIKDDQLPWENVCDLNGDKNRASLIYGITGYPTNYLIDEKGIIIAKDLRVQNLEKKLAELLP